MSTKLTPEQREKILQDILVSLDGRWFVQAKQEPLPGLKLAV
jgi:hypothetical protein